MWPANRLYSRVLGRRVFRPCAEISSPPIRFTPRQCMAPFWCACALFGRRACIILADRPLSTVHSVQIKTRRYIFSIIYIYIYTIIMTYAFVVSDDVLAAELAPSAVFARSCVCVMLMRCDVMLSVFRSERRSETDVRSKRLVQPDKGECVASLCLASPARQRRSRRWSICWRTCSPYYTDERAAVTLPAARCSDRVATRPDRSVTVHCANEWMSERLVACFASLNLTIFVRFDSIAYCASRMRSRSNESRDAIGLSASRDVGACWKLIYIYCNVCITWMGGFVENEDHGRNGQMLWKKIFKGDIFSLSKLAEL